MYGDQHPNAQLIESQGWGIRLEFGTLNETILRDSIQEMLNNSTYKTTAMKFSQIFRDRPLTPLQTAIYWIEYVIRYDGAKHMQSPAVHMNIIQRNSIDVILFLVVVSYIFFKIFRKATKIISKYYALLILSVSIAIYYIISRTSNWS